MGESLPVRLIYTIGYQGRSFEDIRAHVIKLDAVLVDIRYAPYSPRPEFRKAALAQALEGRYRWVQALGNRAYKSGGPVEIVDYPAGRAILAAFDKPAILMCACSHYQICHRHTVAELLRADGFEVQEIASGGEQLSLF